MKRVLGIALVLAAAAALTVFATGASNGGGGRTYWVELDDAFGLISGGDLKIAGVRAGKIGDLKVDQKTHRALVQIHITKNGFGSLRTDVTCQARPQSLIGEYFLDCQPGTSPVELKPGSTIPVSRTSSVVAPDLVQDVLRKPYRERFSIIVNELGAAVAGNGKNLNDAIRRASPGLQETDKVLAILGQQNRIISNLIHDGDKVINDLANNRAQVARWVVEADRASSASAQRATDISAGWQRLPGFLEQLRPAMKDLGDVATEQTPALRTLAAAAPNLKTFFDRLGPFSTVSKPAFQALGKASVTGSKAAKAATPTVALLNSFAKGTPELGGNLSAVLTHLDDPSFAVEPDPRSPGGKGYSGLQALLEYVYDQVLSINIYDSSVHILKVSPFVSPCQDYADIHQALSINKNTGHPLIQDCGASLGPHAAGINFPDTTRPAGYPPYGDLPADDPQSTSARAKELRRHQPPNPPMQSGVTVGPAAGEPKAATPAPTHAPTLSDLIPGAPPIAIPAPPKALGHITPGQQDRAAQDKLLNYLLGG
jgi:virulence factor Mce-like protein